MDVGKLKTQDRPRVMRVDLTELGRVDSAEFRREAWTDRDPAIDRLGRFSGLALGLALFARALEEHRPEDAPFVLAVGDCVRRALPTAARASIVSRSPLSGLLADGQVGSDLGRRFARAADALVITGASKSPTSVLHIGGAGKVELVDVPALADLGPAACARLLRDRFGACATLCTGHAGRTRVAFASLAAGVDPPSFVGRGGLGAVFGRLGLAALVVSAPPVEPDPRDVDRDRDLARLLARSPRLRARGEGGTLELVHAFAARGDLRARNYAESMTAAESLQIASEIASAPHSRKGCEGCPTPCGWVFEKGHPGERVSQGGHFSAVYALGPNLGLASLADALALLARCDELAIDAKETGAVLALLCRASQIGRIAGGDAFGDRARLLAWIDDIVAGRGAGAIARLGAFSLARELGLEHESFTVKRMSARPESSLAAVLGQCASARGADPMRTFPFLLQDGVGRARLEALLAPIPLPARAEDPRDPAGKGRVVWWHENLTAAIDALGFCAFSAAGLLADGVCDLDELARRIGPHEVRETSAPGRELLALGASITTLARRVNARLGARADDDRPEWAARLLDAPSMWREYARMRGLDESGAPTPDAWARLATGAILDVGLPINAGETAASDACIPALDRAPAVRVIGRVELAAFGALARALEPGTCFDVALPATLGEVLAHAATLRPDARASLVRDGTLVPAVYRRGIRLEVADLVHDGDRLDLVIAIGGG